MEPQESTKAALFERIVTPHVEAAWNLTRWLVRDPHDAEDIIQEAYLRAFRSIDDYRGGDAKSWFLTVVRNLCHTFHRKTRAKQMTIALDEQIDVVQENAVMPLEKIEQASDTQQLKLAMERLPAEYREALILREFEGLSYKQIADVSGVPMGTVMSRLARGREKLVALMATTVADEGGTR
ncbi:MAG TPA: sigma-70 family RNA polymerase sigma factor [Tepidisphaeraceae bacterium]|jgi:RNA polymerase sigma-70 factor (ECF subfamily)|nr:sigma-70 family RNA polymerase sigma factor [Tepidisphaeraceae bacterium]